MRSNKRKVCVAVLCAAALCALACYHFSYPIKQDDETLAGHVREYYSRGADSRQDVAIVLYRGGVSVGNRTYYLVDFGEDFGYVCLERGLTGRYKISHLGSGSGSFRKGILADGKENVFLLGGRDIAQRIKKITVTVEGGDYEMDVPDHGGTFLVSAPVAGHIGQSYVHLEDIAFYDETGAEITGEYDLSGGGFG